MSININAAAAASAAAREHAQPAFTDPFSTGANKTLDRHDSPPPSLPSSPFKRVGSWLSETWSRRSSAASQSSLRSPIDKIADTARYIKTEFKKELDMPHTPIGQAIVDSTRKVVDKIDTALEEHKRKQREERSERRMRIAREVEDEVTEAYRQAEAFDAENAARSKRDAAQRELKRLEIAQRRREAGIGQKPGEGSTEAKIADTLRDKAGKLANRVNAHLPYGRDKSPDFFSDAAPPGMMEPCSVCGQEPQGVLTNGRCKKCIGDGKKPDGKRPAKFTPVTPDRALLQVAPGSMPQFSNVPSITPSPAPSLVDETLGHVSSGRPAVVVAGKHQSVEVDVSGPPSPLLPYSSPPRLPRPPYSRPLNLSDLIEADQRSNPLPTNPAASSVYSRATDDDKPFLRQGERMPQLPLIPQSPMLPNPAASPVYSRAPEDDKPYGSR
ncbi:hypothetical protein MBLNU459_g0300t1 [Dothideomycetes sp. NU459]